MSYSTIARIATNESLFQRLMAAAAAEQKPAPLASWVADRRWTIAATPGWAAAWESALAAGDDDPGSRSDVVTDAMILAVIQPMD